MRRIVISLSVFGLLIWLGSQIGSDEPSMVRRQIAGVPSVPAKAAASVSPPTQTDARQQLLNEIQKTKACYDPQICEFPHNDEKSYEIALNQKLAGQIRMFASLFKVSEAQNDFEALAREFIRSDDGFVQDAALDLLKQLPISEENLAALSEGLVNSPDPSVVEKGLSELQRYLGTNQEAAVHGLLSKIMTEGAHFTSQTVATAISPFINNASYSEYLKTERAMSQNTTTAQRLKSALNEYQRQRSGS